MKTLILITLILGSFLGAGFVSGREISAYFSIYGINSIWGIIVAVLLLFVLLEFFFFLSNKCDSFSKFVSMYFGKLGEIVNLLFAICLVILISSMFAGSREIANSLSINSWLFASITGLLCFLVIIGNVKSVTKINFILVPILLIILSYVTFGSINLGVKESNFFATIFSSVNYIFINIVTLGVFILEIGKDYTPKQKHLASILSCLIILVLLIFGNSAILNYNLEESAMPILYLSSTKGGVVWWLTAVTIWLGLFTTLVSSAYVLCNYLSKFINNTYLSAVITICIGLVMSTFGFDIMVGYIYSIIGLIGVIIVARVIFKEKETSLRLVSLNFRKKN